MSNEEVRYYLEREGINADQVFSQVSNESGKAFLRSIVEKVSVASEKLSGPLDDLLIKGFNGAFDAKTLLRRNGNRLKLSEAEIWWEEKGNSLKDVHQKEIAVRWLAESIFPIDILNDLDSVSQGKGKYWEQKFLDVSEKLLYVFPRYGFSDSLGSYLNGFSTIGQLSVAGVGGFASNLFVSESKGRGDQAFDHYWAVYRPLITDFKKVFKNSKVDINVDVTINEILWGAYEKFQFDISNMYQKTTWLATSLGIATALGITRGKIGLAQSVLFSLGSKWLGKKYPELVSEDILKEVVETSVRLSQKIIDLNEEKEKWSEVYNEVGIGTEIQDLIEKGSTNNKKKSVFLSFSEKQTAHAIAWLTGFLSNGTLASGSMVAQCILYSSMRNVQRKTTFDYRRELREKALEKFRGAFGELKGDRGIIRNLVNKEATKLDKNKSLNIQIKSIGVPEFKSANDTPVHRFLFESGFKIKSGKIYPVYGPNASGKTTLTDVLAGRKVGQPDLTKITINGMDFNHLSLNELKHSIRFISRSDSNFDLKTTCAEIIMNYSTSLKNFKVDTNRIKSWVLNKDDYPEVEVLIIDFVNKQTDMLAINKDWFRDKKYIPSGMQQSVLKIVLNLMIDEPVLLVTDETAGEMTDGNSKRFRSFIGSINLGKKAIMPILNKDIKDWLSVTNIGGIINTERDVVGRMILLVEDNPYLPSEDLLIEIKKSIAAGRLVEPHEFLMVLDKAEDSGYVSKNIDKWISNLENTKGYAKQNERFNQAVSILKILDIKKDVDCKLEVILDVVREGSFSWLNTKFDRGIRHTTTQLKIANCYELVSLYNNVAKSRQPDSLTINGFDYNEYVRWELNHNIKIFSFLERDEIAKTVLVNTQDLNIVELFRVNVVKGLSKLGEKDKLKAVKRLRNLYGSPCASSRKSVWEALEIKDY